MAYNKSKTAHYQPPSYASTLSRTHAHTLSNATNEKSETIDHNDNKTLVTRQRRSFAIGYFIDWALKILGAFSAIVFGVWAPVSYHLQVLGNKSSDEAQDKLVAKIEDLVREVRALRAAEVCKGDDGKVSDVLHFPWHASELTW